MTKRRLYLAAPLFNPQELAFNQLVADILATSFDVYLPQRDGGLIPGGGSVSTDFDKLAEQVFEYDTRAIDQSEVIFAILDGRSIDEGVAFELGYGFATGKQCVGMKTDHRTLLPGGDNPMITGALSRVFRSVAEVRHWLSKDVLDRK